MDPTDLPELSKPFRAQNFKEKTEKMKFQNFEKKIEKSTPYETVTNAMKSTQNLSPGRFRHAEAESEVKNLQNFHPDLEIQENDL